MTKRSDGVGERSALMPLDCPAHTAPDDDDDDEGMYSACEEVPRDLSCLPVQKYRIK
jgi:hypothetical protein